jgi:MFS family permease
MERRLQLMCALSGPAFLVLLVVGLWFVAGLIPPLSPADSAEHVAAFYRGHQGQVRVGMLICMLALPLLAPFIVLISRQIRETDPRLGLLADVQLVCGIVGMVIFMLPILLLATIGFRPDISPTVVRTLNDLAWVTLLWTFSPFTLEYAAVGIAVLTERGERPVHPRWVGVVSLLTALIFAFGGPTLWALHGVFAWGGVLTLWAVLGAFGVWVLAMSWSMIQAIPPDGARATPRSAQPVAERV